MTERPPHTRVGLRATTLLVTVVLAVLVGGLLNLVTVPRVVYHPGPVYDTLGSIRETEVVQLDEELETYEDTAGNLYFTTIRLEGGPGDPLTAWEWLRSRFDPTTTIVPREQVFPEGVDAEQVREQNTALMQHSQEDAAVVALRAHGTEVPEDVMVAQVMVGKPADGVLHVDDQILAVEDTAVSSTRQVQDQIQDVTPGQPVELTLLREGEEVALEVPTTRDEETGRTIVGVYLAPLYELPYEISIDAGNVGGPSAGLMFSLAVYDKLTPGPLTDGRSVAGSGTITGTGQVGGIGGITQKMYAAQSAGAELFLAPAGNCGEVVTGQPDDLVVVAVHTFEDALDALEQTEGVQDLSTLDLPTCQNVLDGAGQDD